MLWTPNTDRPTDIVDINWDSPQAQGLLESVVISPYLRTANNNASIITSGSGAGATIETISEFTYALNTSGGTNHSAHFTLPQSLPSVTNFTFASWAYRLSDFSYGGFGGVTSPTHRVVIDLSSSGAKLGYVWENTADEVDANQLNVPLNEWTLVALVVSSTAATLYSISSTYGFTSWTNTKTHNAQDFSGQSWYIGNDSYGDGTLFNFPGYTAAQYIALRSLSSFEIWSLYSPDTRWDLYQKTRRWWFGSPAARKAPPLPSRSISRLIGAGY